MLVKRNPSAVQRNRGAVPTASSSSSGLIDRRAFLRNSGLAAGGLAALGAFTAGTVRKASAAEPRGIPTGEYETRKSVCTHCSVGCTVIAEVENGVWVGQPIE